MKRRTTRDAIVQPQDQSIRCIPLTQGKIAIVDASDFARLAPFKWVATKKWKTWYAKRDVVFDGHKSSIYMHGEILGTVSGKEIDHEDGDGLNNRRKNLRHLTHQQNIHRSRSFSKSGFKGITWHKKAGKWMAQIQIQSGKNVYLGCHDTAEQAARAYDDAAVEYFGEFARLNFPHLRSAV